MNSDSQPRLPTYTYDTAKLLTRIVPAPAADRAEPLRPPRDPLPNPRAALFDFEHDAAKGIFRITDPDGRIEVFRDKPVRHLVVEPDPESGQMKPVVTRGCPTVLYLCREEREVR